MDYRALQKQQKLFLKLQKQIHNIKATGTEETSYQNYENIPYDPNPQASETKEERYLRKKREKKQQKVLEEQQDRRGQTTVLIPRQVMQSDYRIYQFIIDANDRNKTLYPTLKQFVIKTAEPFKNVFAIRLMRSELLYVSGVLGKGLYVSLNNYKQLYRNETQDSINMFARINPGIDQYANTTTNTLDDPYTHVLNPVDPKLQRFEVRLYDFSNVPTLDINFNLTLHLAIFSYN